MIALGTIASTPFLAEGGFGALMPLVFVLIFIISIVRAIRQAQQAKDVHKASGDEAEEERRAREIRERLRRVIAERKGEAPPMTTELSERRAMESQPEPAERSEPPPVRRVPPLDPFGGPVPRTLAELQRRLAPKPEPKPMAAPAEPARREPVPQPEPMTMPRRMSVSAAAQAISMSEITSLPGSGRGVSAQDAALRTEARRRVLEDVRDPQGLRRAIVLREILGPPVGLRR